MPRVRKLVRMSRSYLYIFPLVLLFGFGVLTRTTEKVTKVNSGSACQTGVLSGLIDLNEKTAHFDGADIDLPREALAYEKTTPVLGVASPNERWIEVDLSEQKLKAWDGGALFLETSIASGLPHTPTPTGEFRIWTKLRATKMEGGQGRYYYYLPNVPYVMFFENDKVPGWKGYGLHGTYWHNSFGTPRSHGCVNLPTPIAKELYYWTTPELIEGKNIVRASDGNVGTRIVIHE